MREAKASRPKDSSFDGRLLAEARLVESGSLVVTLVVASTPPSDKSAVALAPKAANVLSMVDDEAKVALKAWSEGESLI